MNPKTPSRRLFFSKNLNPKMLPRESPFFSEILVPSPSGSFRFQIFEKKKTILEDLFELKFFISLFEKFVLEEGF